MSEHAGPYAGPLRAVRHTARCDPGRAPQPKSLQPNETAFMHNAGHKKQILPKQPQNRRVQACSTGVIAPNVPACDVQPRAITTAFAEQPELPTSGRCPRGNGTGHLIKSAKGLQGGTHRFGWAGNKHAGPFVNSPPNAQPIRFVLTSCLTARVLFAREALIAAHGITSASHCVAPAPSLHALRPSNPLHQTRTPTHVLLTTSRHT